MSRPPSRLALLGRFVGHRLRRIGPIFAATFLAAATALHLLEREACDSKLVRFGDALWFCVVTMSTVGYGDAFPVTAAGRVVTGMFILFTLTTVGLVLTAVSESIMEVRRMEDAGLIGTRMRDHVVVCGFNSMARATLVELLAAGRRVALLCERADDIARARDELPRAASAELFVTSGEATQDLLRDRLNLGQASAAVVALEDDARNLIATLNIRAVAPGIRLIVALQREELRQTLEAGGVTYVASPNELSGRLVASAAFEPEVARLVEDLMSGSSGDTDLQQYQAGTLAGLTVAELRTKLEEIDGPLLVALAKPQGDGAGYQLVANPARDLRVAAEDHVLVMTSEAQAARLQDRFGLRQGR